MPSYDAHTNAHWIELDRMKCLYVACVGRVIPLPWTLFHVGTANSISDLYMYEFELAIFFKRWLNCVKHVFIDFVQQQQHRYMCVGYAPAFFFLLHAQYIVHCMVFRFYFPSSRGMCLTIIRCVQRGTSTFVFECRVNW